MRASICLAGVLSLGCVPSFVTQDGDTDGVEWPDESRLDRSAACELEQGYDCGYPAGPYSPSYGNTFPNIVVQNCDGEAVELAELFGIRPDTQRLNRGVIFAFGAGWCGSCKQESEHFAEIVGDYRVPEYDVEFLHFIVEAELDSPATENICSIWYESLAKAAYPVWFTPDPNFMDTLIPAGTPIPYIFILNANARVNYTQQGAISDANLINQIDALVSNPYG